MRFCHLPYQFEDVWHVFDVGESESPPRLYQSAGPEHRREFRRLADPVPDAALIPDVMQIQGGNVVEPLPKSVVHSPDKSLSDVLGVDVGPVHGHHFT